MGVALLQAGRTEKAVRYYRLYLKYCPTAADAPQVTHLIDTYDQR